MTQRFLKLAQPFSIGFLLAVTPLAVSANSAAIEACRTVYSEATTDLTKKKVRDIETSYYYGLYCEENGEVRGSAQASSVGFKLFGVPLSGSHAELANEETVRKFCKENEGFNDRNIAEDFLERTVVRPSLESFNDCIKIANESKALTLSHETGLEAMVIRGNWHSSNNAGKLNAVVIQGAKGECKSASFSKKEQTLGDNVNIALSDDETFAITCRRQAQSGDTSQTKNYPSMTVIVDTSWGSYKAVMPAETLQSFELASQAAVEHGKLLMRIKDLKSQIDELVGEVLKWKTLYQTTKAYSVRVSEWGIDADFHVRCHEKDQMRNNTEFRKEKAKDFCAAVDQRYRGIKLLSKVKEGQSGCWTDVYVLLCTGTL